VITTKHVGRAANSGQLLVLGGLLLLAIIVPFLLNGFQLFILSIAVCYMVATIGFNIALGWAGLLIFTGSAFFGLGAFVAGRLASLGVAAEFAILAAALAGALVGLGYGALTVKLNSYYFAITGIVLMYFLDFFYRTFPAITGGYSGFRIPQPRFLLFGNVRLSSQLSMYFVALLLAVLAYVAARMLERSPVGRGWRVVRKSPAVAASLGINVWRSKLYAVVASSIFLAVSGAWFGYLSLRFLPETFMFTELIFFFLILIVGGLGSVNGMVFGSLTMVLLREYLRAFPGTSEIIYGVILLVAVLVFSKGLYGTLSRRYRFFREGVV
jgi:branched-chain amino acid transport system permease protein